MFKESQSIIVKNLDITVRVLGEGMFSLIATFLNIVVATNYSGAPSQDIIRHQLNNEQFQALIQSKTFFAECYAYQHPVFKSARYSISYNEDKSFKETLYLFAKNDCKGSLTLLESAGSYGLGSQLENEVPTREVDYKYESTGLRLFNPVVRKKLAEMYRDSECRIDMKKAYDNFSLKERSCFGFDMKNNADVEFDIIGLATDRKGDDLFLFGGQRGEGTIRPLELNYNEKLL